MTARPGGHGVGFTEALGLWARIGLTGFGGPAGQIALMHRLVVEERRWIGEERFLHALNYCMLLPGPEAQQLATYVGWLLHRIPGGIAAGMLFVLPGALVMLGLSALYAGFQDMTLVQAVFYGIKAAVLAVVVEAVLRIGRRALQAPMLYGLAAVAFVGIFFMEIPFPLIIVAAGTIGLAGGRWLPQAFAIGGAAAPAPTAALDAALDDGALAHTRPSLRRAVVVTAACLAVWAAPVVAAAQLFGDDPVFTELGLFFSKMAVITFGGAYAVLAYVAQQAVETHGWLTAGEMLNGLGLAETTPGPLILVLQFVGFLAGFRQTTGFDPWLGGVVGALITTWVTFAPSFLWIFLGAPYIEQVRGNRALAAALAAITAAVVGVILNLSIWFALHVVFADVGEVRRFGLRLLVPDVASVDPAALVLAAVALIAMVRYKVGMLPTLVASAVLGGLWFMAAR
jgi:chromate transporter